MQNWAAIKKKAQTKKLTTKQKQKASASLTISREETTKRPWDDLLQMQYVLNSTFLYLKTFLIQEEKKLNLLKRFQLNKAVTTKP